MKKFILFLLLLALVMPVALAQKDEELPLGSRGLGTLQTDHFTARPAQSAGTDATMARQGKEKADAMDFPPYPYEDTFLLHSYPSSNYKLYIDFDGHRGVYKVWDPANDGAAFSDAERLLIQKIWFLTSEDYMPFTIDVTTEEPGAGFLGMRAVVDGSDKYDYGWAYKNVWPDSDNFAYTGTWNNDWIYIAQAASHEVGHTLNLYDHGQTDGTGYYMGHGEGWTAWGVIMGWDSWSLGVWDDGNYPIPNHPEDSLNIIETRVGVNYRPDDHGSTTGTATAITIPATLGLVAEGIIEQVTDVDYFSFTMASSGDVSFSINEDVVMGCTNLDVLAKIHDSEGAVLYESNPLWDIWASFSVTLPAGDYYLSIDGTGQDHPDGEPWEGYGYSDYGILGYYSILAQEGTPEPDVTPPTPDPMTFAVAPGATGNTSVAMIATTATDTENGVEYYFTCTAGGGNDSDWQTSTYYEDTGLTAATEYTYTVTARDTSPAQNETAASAPASATTSDGVNIVLPANGGLLESFTSEYSSSWGSAAALTNGSTTDIGWCSEINPSSPQEFVYSFDSGQDATLDSAVMHTGDGEGGVYLSKDVEVWTSANGTDFILAGSATLPKEKYRAVGIDLGGVTAKKVKLSITSGYRTDYWEMGEFVVLGGIGGGDNVIVPDVVGMAQATAEAAIVAADLTVGTVTTDYSPTVPAGDVISQDPTGGASVPSGSSVDLVVSLGILMVDVPDVVGMAQASAEAAIVAANLVVGTVTNESSETVPAGDVISQDPTGGASVAAGSSVDLVVSTGPAGSASLTDDFEGTLANWSTDWDLVTDYYQSATHSVQCSAEDNDLVSINVDTSGASTNVRVQFKYRISGIDTNDYVNIYYWDGSAYDMIDNIGDDAENIWLTYDHTTTDAQYRNSTFKIYIEGTQVDPAEILWIDDVSITCQ